MSDQRIPISQLSETQTAPDASYIAIDDGSLTKKITVENFNSTSTASAQQYANQAAASAQTVEDNIATSAAQIREATLAAREATQASTSATASATSAYDSASLAQNYSVNAATSAGQAMSAADSASQAITESRSHAQDSEAWAVGKRNGSDVPASDETYQNNAKYYASNASGSATRAEAAAESINVPDTTLTVSGVAADSKATGDRISAADAELADVRVKSDGTTAATAGDAVREQITELRGDVSAIEEGKVEFDLIADKYVRFDNGALGIYVGLSATDFIPCADYRTLYIKGSVYSKYNAFYEAANANTFIGSFTTKDDVTAVTVPENAKYVRLSGKTSVMQAIEVFNLWRAKLADSEQTLKDISGFVNYIDGVGWTDGYSISGSGAITEGSGFKYSDLIPVSDGHYYLSYIPNGQNRNTRIHGYDSNGTWVKQLGVSASYSGTSQIIFDFWCDGVASIRISTGTTEYTYIAGLYKGANMTRLDSNMVWEEIPMSSGEITTNNGTQYIPSYNIYINTSNPNARCAVIDCEGGDYFTINAYGAGGPTAYAFVDSTNKILAIAKGREEVHGIFQAPNGSKKLVINDYRGFTSFKGVEPVAGFEKLSDVQTVIPAQLGSKNWVARLGWEADSVGTGGPPRQSIVSYRMAYNHNCRIMLTDLQVTADNVLVCLHDANLDTYVRHADGSALSTEEKAQLVKDLTLAELNAYDWGVFYGAIYAGTKVLTVDEFLRFCSYTGCIAVIETKIMMTTANIEALKNLAIKHCMVDRVVLFDSVSWYAANRTAWETNFPKNDVIFNNVTTDNAYDAAKTLTASRTSSGLNTSISTSFGYITDTKIAEYNALGGTFYYTEVKEESDLDTLMEDGHLNCLRYIASSYININKWLKEQYSF